MNARHLVPTLALSLALAGKGLAQGHQKLYVLSSNSDDMTVIDVATNTIIGSIEVGPLPHGIASPASQDVLYVSTEDDGGVTVIDPVKDKVITRYKIFGKRPNEIDVTSDGRYLYVPTYGAGVYEVFDTVKEEIVARIPTDGLPHNAVVSPDDRHMYFSPMDKGTRTVEEMRAQGLPTSENDKIYVVDAATHTVEATIPTGNTPRPIAVSPDGHRLFVNTDGLMGFVVLDLEKRKMVSRAEYELDREHMAMLSRSHGIGVTPDGREVWSTNINHGFVHVFDVTVDPPKQIARLKTGRSPLWLTITPDGRTVYVANTADDTVSAFDVATKTEVARIQIERGKGPKRMLVVSVPVAGR